MTWKPTKLTLEQMEERRLKGGRLLKEKRLIQAEIARELGVSRAAVGHWAKRMRSGGLKRIQQLIWQEFEVDYHPNYINRLMRRLNWSWQQPLPQAIQRDEAAIAIWREQDWPRIKKSAPDWG